MSGLKMTEGQWQKRITNTATLNGWRWAHFRVAKVRADRWATPQSGDKGFPDLVLARGGVVILAELKTDVGDFREGQEEWLAQLGGYGRCWRPADWPAVLAELTEKRVA